MDDTRLRVLRQKHHISLFELAEAADISYQYLSRIELGEVRATPLQEEKMDAAVRQLIYNRENALHALKSDYSACQGLLLRSKEDT